MADKIVLTNVKEKDDVFKWSELNCFYRTFAVALNSVNEAYYDIFLLLISAYGTFVVNGDRTLRRQKIVLNSKRQWRKLASLAHLH